jgi:hypothetical protein
MEKKSKQKCIQYLIIIHPENVYLAVFSSYVVNLNSMQDRTPILKILTTKTKEHDHSKNATLRGNQREDQSWKKFKINMYSGSPYPLS